MHTFPTPCILQSSSVCSFPIEKYSCPRRPRFCLPFIPDTPSFMSSSTNLFNTDKILAVLATLVFMMYTVYILGVF